MQLLCNFMGLYKQKWGTLKVLSPNTYVNYQHKNSFRNFTFNLVKSLEKMTFLKSKGSANCSFVYAKSAVSFDFLANCAPYKSKLRLIPVILLQFQEELHSMERYFAKARPRGQKQKLSLQRKSNVNVVALKASFYANGFDVSTS